MDKDLDFNKAVEIPEEKMKGYLEYERKQKLEAERKQRLDAFLNPEDPTQKEFNNAIWEKGGLKDVYEKKPEIFDDQGRFKDNFEFAISKYEAYQSSQQKAEDPTPEPAPETSGNDKSDKTLNVHQQRSDFNPETQKTFSIKDMSIKDMVEKGLPNGEKLPPHIAAMAKIFG